MTSDTSNMKEITSLLYDTNARLCDQVEIFDAIAAKDDTDATRDGRKPTAIGQLRLHLEEENRMLQSTCEQKVQGLFVQSLLEESKVPTASIQGKVSTGKGKAGPTPTSTGLIPNPLQNKSSTSPVTEDKVFGLSRRNRYSAPVPFHMQRAGKRTESDLSESEAPTGVQGTLKTVLNYYQIVFSRNPERYSHINTAFRIEFARAEQWGNHFMGEKRAPALWSFCESILASKRELLSKVLQLSDSQGLLHSLSKQGGFTLSPPHSKIPPELLSPGHEAFSRGETASKGSSGSSQKSFEGWLEESVCQLSNWNESLLDLSPPSMQESWRRELRIELSTSSTVKPELLESASNLLGHSDLEQLAKAIAFHRLQLSSKDSVPWLNQAEIHSRDVLSTSDEMIASATYRDEVVITQWFRPASEPNEDMPLTRNLSSFREIMNSSLIPLKLSSLQILGYSKQKPGLVGCVYRLPPDTFSHQLPVTLRELLDRAKKDTRPELGERFELATALVKTVHELNIMGLFHGNIRPANILFWPKQDTRTKPNIGRPYLVGFRDEIPRWFFPELKDRTVSRRLDDLYQLGLVLFEIGTWGHAYKGREADPRSRLHDQIERLSVYVGSRYAEAVEACLEGHIVGILEHFSPADQRRVYLKEVQTRVVDPIAMCNA